MIKKRTYIILIVSLFTFFIVMYFLFGATNLKERKYEGVFLVGNHSVFAYQKQTWLNIKLSESDFKEFNWHEYEVYQNQEKLGDYSLWYDDKWYAFDQKRNAIKIPDDFIAFYTNYDVDVLKYQEDNFDSSVYVDRVLEENQLLVTSQFTSKYKVSFDFDQDQKEEDLYVISNVFPMDFKPEKLFSIVFMVKDNKIYYLYKDVRDNLDYNGCKPFIHSIIDVDKDGKYEFIVSCASYSVSEQVDMLFKFEEDQFRILVSNP